MNNKTPGEMRSGENQRARTSIISKREKATGALKVERKTGKDKEKRGLASKPSGSLLTCLFVYLYARIYWNEGSGVQAAGACYKAVC